MSNQKIYANKGEIKMESLDGNLESYAKSVPTQKSFVEDYQQRINESFDVDGHYDETEDDDYEESSDPRDMNEIPSVEEINEKAKPLNNVKEAFVQKSEKVNTVLSNTAQPNRPNNNNNNRNEERRMQQQQQQQTRPQQSNQPRFQNQGTGRKALESNKLGIAPVSVIFNVSTVAIKKHLNEFLASQGFPGIQVVTAKSKSKKSGIELIAVIPASFSRKTGGTSSIAKLTGDTNFARYKIDPRLRNVLSPFAADDSKVNIPKSKDYSFVPLSLDRVIVFLFNIDRSVNCALINSKKIDANEAVLTIGKEAVPSNSNSIDIEKLLKQINN